MKIYRSKIYDIDIEDINVKLLIDLDEFSNPNDNEGYIEITSINASNKNSCFWIQNLSSNQEHFCHTRKQDFAPKCLPTKGILEVAHLRGAATCFLLTNPRHPKSVFPR